jgi:hypothetical protein
MGNEAPTEGGGRESADGRSFSGVAYGLEFRGIEVEPGLLAPSAGGFPPVWIAHDPVLPPEGESFVDAQSACLRLRDGQRAIAIDRVRSSAVYHGPRVPDDELVHPYLGPVATVFARWLGREAFHAGAFLVKDGAWALLGTNEAGKSTLLAAFAGRGGEVVCDDIVVVDGENAFAGPRCIDLRAPPDRSGLPITEARAGSRWRVALPEIQPTVPLRGWVFLSWGSEHELREMGPVECLNRLALWRAWRKLPSDPKLMLKLAGLPAMSLSRSRRWDTLDATIDELTNSIASARPKAT